MSDVFKPGGIPTMLNSRLYTKESEGSKAKAEIELLVPDPDIEIARAAILKNTQTEDLKEEDSDDIAARPD